MFTSAGIDNLELKLAVTQDEADALRCKCKWQMKDGKHFGLLGTATNPLIILHFQPSRVLADLNAPKIGFGHNIRLAGPEQVKTAISVLAQNTELVAPRLNWQCAEVSRLHVTFTREVPDFEACADLGNAPRGAWEQTEYYPNIYHNANGKNAPVIIYDKVKHLRSAGFRLPNDVGREMESFDHRLFRFEARLNQSVFVELKKHGGWNELSILAEDLCGAGFTSAMTYLLWRFKRHVPIPIDRTPKMRSGVSAREYAMMNTRRTANEHSARMREQAHADHNAGHITNHVLQKELSRIAVFERRGLALSLHAALESEMKQNSENVVTVHGNLNTPEFEHAARTRGHAYAI